MTASFAILLLACPLIATAAETNAGARDVDLKCGDGTALKATYFAAAKPGPAVILFHQSNRTRDSWKDVAAQLVTAGINVLTIDSRGHGESGGNEGGRKVRLLDQDAAFEFLISQPGVNRQDIGLGGAGVIGVENATEAAHRHPAEVKSLVLLSGEAFHSEREFLHHAPQLPGLYILSDEDEYPPIEEAMQLLYANAASPAKKLVHYAAAEEAPWLWYEPLDVGKVPAHGGHGTDLFKPHPELPGIILNWFVTTLLKTPGHAPADPIAAAPLLNDVEFNGGARRAEQQLRDARDKDPQAQLWPEISMTTIAEGMLSDGHPKEAVQILELNLEAYPNSADIEDNLADAYLADAQKELARQHAAKALTLLDSHAAPASSWTDTEQYRGEIRRDAEKILKQLNARS